ncbi:MAG TPA: glycosyltransferase family 4 protein [Blastocatellia bacterium]|nr:glycosyltransferase family 4 protein [Blastocatellia bacterium]
MKRILFVAHRFWPYPGGSERLFYELAVRTANRGHEVAVYTTDAWDPESFHKSWKKRLPPGTTQIDGIHLTRFPIRYIPWQFKILGGLSLIPFDPIRLLVGFPHILVPGYLEQMFIRQPEFNLIVAGVFPHTHMVYPAAWLANRHGVPWVAMPLIHTGHKDGSPLRGYLESPRTRLLRHARSIITLTEAEAGPLVRNGIDAGKIHSIGLGVDASAISGGDPLRFRNRYGIIGPIVLQISTQTRAKGSVDLVEAMKKLWAEGSQAKLVMLGPVTTDFEEYMLAQSPSVYEKTAVLGFASDETKRDALAAADVFVMASSADAFGAVYLEAWMYEKPVVAARAGGAPYIVSDGGDGLLVEYGDSGSLAAGIRRLLTDDALRLRLGKAGREKALSRFTWEKTFDRFWDEIGPLLGS